MKSIMNTLSNRAVENLKVEKDTVFWDRELSGFGVRIYPTGSKIYIAQVRGPEGSKRITIGRHGVIRTAEARKRAALFIARVKSGEGPVKKPPKPARETSVGELAKRYMEEYAKVRYKPRTLASTRTVVHRHIVPSLGKLTLAAVQRAHITELHERLCSTPAVANRVVRILSLMYRLAEEWGLAHDGYNPCRAIRKYPDRRRERFLTEAEFERLGKTLHEAKTRGGASAPAVAALKLLMLTGCRKNEILSLRWENVALFEAELRLPDAKTGARVVSLSEPAVRLLDALPRLHGNPWVIPGRKPGTHMHGIEGAWKIIRKRAGLEGVRIHDLRHSFASRALALGEGLPMIGKLLGHAHLETTARYAHLTRDSVRASAIRIAESVAADISGED